MKGDFTRDTFDPIKQFSRVLMQQGRVQLDADWNEQTSILLHYIRTLAMDLLGPHAGPDNDMRFDLITKQTVTSWGNQAEEKWKSIETVKDRSDVFKSEVGDKGNVVISAGRYYVDGILVENHRPILYTEQVGYPFTREGELSNLQNKDLLVYLDVWERHITYVQDDHIREVALGGADACTRAQVVWQVKPLLPAEGNGLGCDSLEKLLARDNLPRLRAHAKRVTSSPELCTMSPESKYLGLENQLYRVEVHEADGVDKAEGKAKKPTTFKWSRDNASVVFPIVALHGTTVNVTSLGRDRCSQLKPGDWVEVCDDIHALREQSGILAQVERVDRDELKVTLKWPDGVNDLDLPDYAEGETPNKHPLLRRWDHAGDLAAYHGALPITESAEPDQGWIALEDGVEIWFAKGGEYRVGDYWLIPARVTTGDVEWPVELENNGAPKRDSNGNSIPAEQMPQGPKHHYAPLVLFLANGTSKECYCRFQGFACPQP